MPTLKYQVDVRMIAYAITMVALFATLWITGFSWPAYLMLLFFAMCMGPAAHSHAHAGIFHQTWANRAWDYVLSFCYGFPIFVWIPTHMMNHHVFGNRPGDATITWRLTRKDTTWMAAIYPVVSSYYQNPLTMHYLQDNWKRGPGRRTRFWEAMAQYAVWGAFVGGFLWLDWRRALLYIGGPTAVSLWMVMFFNYVQHVNCDAESKWNHSRNFVGPVLNAWLFNNGYHTVHHWKPTEHWSKLPELHASVSHLIHPELQLPQVFVYLFRTYVVGIFIGPKIPDFTGHVGSEERLPKPPPAPRSWDPKQVYSEAA